IALAAFSALKRDKNKDPILLVLAADHIIKNEEAFCEAIKSAMFMAEEDKIVTFGIIPTYAETGYGYINIGARVESNIEVDNAHFYVAKKFVEKPERELAEKYFSSKKYLWNSGMFMFKASVFLSELKKYRPDIFEVCEEAISASSKDLDFIRLPERMFEKCPSESIDFAVMENTKRCVVCPVDIGWSDVGSWQSLWELSDKSPSGDVCKGDTLTYNTKNNYIYSDSALVAAVGVENIVIVQTKDAVLVANKSEV
ncbi:TPA: sugar phosphate nucleotidyltransferase, partial [Escherichia coli]